MYRDRVGQIIKEGATVQTPAGALGKVKSFTSDGRANIVYEWTPKWQPKRNEKEKSSLQSLTGAKEVILKAELLRVV
jgi:preprotein translocase subunit YajC